MIQRKFSAWFGKLTVIAAGALAVGLLAATPAMAQHKANANDMELPTNDMEIVTKGRGLLAQRCAFCHGGDAHGGKGPCLTCGSFHYTGNTNAEIYATIAAGVSKNLGGTMGAFGTTMSMEQIMAVMTFIRWEENRRITTGEIPNPYSAESNKQVEFPGDKKY
jgi:mono/diheme cytochrome c family protein